MKFTSQSRKPHISIVVLASTALITALCSGQDEETPDHSKHVGMAEQIKELQIEVARLKAAVGTDHELPSVQSSGDHKAHTSSTGPMSDASTGMEMKDGMPMGKMGMEKGMQMKEMGMMKGMDMGGMSKMSGDSGMAMGKSEMRKGMKMMGGMGMKMMGKMPDTSMATASLPGFAGASHIYHIGSSGFFLDHADHLGLSTEQQKQINSIKEDSVLSQNETDRQIESAEETLWKLTSEGEPDSEAIEAKLKEIAELTVQKRLQFISSVGEAARILTKEQIDLLTGEAPSADMKTDSPSDAHQHDEPK